MPDDGPIVVAAATTHRVAGYVHRAVQQYGSLRGLDPDSAKILAARAMETAMGHLQVLADLSRLQALFDERGLRWCVLKGPAAAELLHGEPWLRRYVDLDVLLDPVDFEEGVRCLEQAGAQTIDRNWATLLAWQHTQIHMRLWTGTVLDLHWHMLNEDADREAFDVDSDAILARVRRVDLGGVTVPTLDAEDMLVHLCVHAASAGGQRLGWLRDIQLAARVAGLDWDLVASRSQESGTTLVTATMMSMAGVTLGDADVRAAGRTLSPSPMWTGMGRAVARISPAARWRGTDHVTLGWVVCRSTRETVPRSILLGLRNTPRLIRRWLTSTRVRARLRPLRDRVCSPTKLRDRALPGDGPHARPAYFRWVAATGSGSRTATSGYKPTDSIDG